MSFMQWKAEYNLGIPSIDQQHRRLVAMINALEEGMQTKGRYTDNILRQIFVELGDYTASHFSYEEMLFDEHGYEDGEAHKQQHMDLLDQVLDYQMRVEHGGMDVGPELLEFLQNWLRHHILGSDRDYAEFFLSKDVK